MRRPVSVRFVYKQVFLLHIRVVGFASFGEMRNAIQTAQIPTPLLASHADISAGANFRGTVIRQLNRLRAVTLTVPEFVPRPTILETSIPIGIIMI